MSGIGDFFELNGGRFIDPPKELDGNCHWISAAGMKTWDNSIGSSFCQYLPQVGKIYGIGPHGEGIFWERIRVWREGPQAVV
ncbi:nbp family basal body protein [Lasius niger]|uniref:Nbp family basal body protein n=1 Tax=Lasius niger TaxID=67767 RepID=A0A0J7MZE2_LASNI|nr:nbp family basal body protein [Lasius niger]